MPIISENNHKASARAVCAVQHTSKADSSTDHERLRALLAASNSRHCIACTQPMLPAGLPKK